MTDLFGDTGPAKRARAKKAAAPGNPAVTRAMEAYYGWFKRRFDCKPIGAGGRLAKHLKDMVDAWGEAETLRVIEVFFTTRDPQVASRDYSVAVFLMHAQRLKIGNAPVDRRRAENLQEAAKAAGRR